MKIFQTKFIPFFHKFDKACVVVSASVSARGGGVF